MARDYYTEALEISDELESGGQGEIGDELRHAISAGATATEILMGIRWTLDRALGSAIDLGATREKMRSLKEALDEVLR